MAESGLHLVGFSRGDIHGQGADLPKPYQPGSACRVQGLAQSRLEGGENRVSCERVLPDGVAFTAAVFKEKENVAGLELSIRNGSATPLKQIALQTCAFLRAIKEFADYTADNKFVHVPQKGWVTFKEAEKQTEDTGKYGLGWRARRNHKLDVPMMVTRSNKADRLVAMTWLDATLSMIQNPNHPCMHSDPQFHDLEPGQDQTIHGRLIFHEGPLQEFKYEQYL